MADYDYDMLVIGSGPAGQRAAIQAAKLDKHGAIVERKAVVGGVCLNTGTIPSKTLREAVMHLSGYRERGVYGASYAVKQNITVDDLLFRADHVMRHEIDVTRHQLMRNRVELLYAEASFVDPHTVQITYVDGRGQRLVTAGHVVIATGTRATKDGSTPIDGQSIFLSDDILHLDHIPRTLAVVGAGVIGLEYASMFAALGVRVTLIDKRNRLLPFVDSEIVDALVYHLRQNRVTLRLGEIVNSLEAVHDEKGERVHIRLASGKKTAAEKALYSIGRTGATQPLNLPAAGIQAGGHGACPAGRKQRSRTPMSHLGRANLRTVLYFACLRLVKVDPRFQQLYQELQTRAKNPLTKLLAIGVLMNKLLHLVWALIQHKTFYNPAEVSLTA